MVFNGQRVQKTVFEKKPGRRIWPIGRRQTYDEEFPGAARTERPVLGVLEEKKKATAVSADRIEKKDCKWEEREEKTRRRIQTMEKFKLGITGIAGAYTLFGTHPVLLPLTMEQRAAIALSLVVLVITENKFAWHAYDSKFGQNIRKAIYAWRAQLKENLTPLKEPLTPHETRGKTDMGDAPSQKP